jgi:menaquinone-9 beta-reductase
MKGRPRTVEVAVLGAGPAGVASACALRRLGHTVTLFGRAPQRALEGLSLRAQALLEHNGLSVAAACAMEPAERGGCWGGSPVSAGHEFIVDRTVFDRALAEDAAAHGVYLEHEFALAIEPDAGGYRVRTRSGIHRARVLIDARGRRSGRSLARGPSLIALSQRLSAVPASPPRTLICPLDEGWGWFASDGTGGAVLQLIAASRGLAREVDPAQRLRECLAALLACDRTLERARLEGVPQARAASARLAAGATLPQGWLSAGDAAVAMDPLSGHGLYEALAWAATASAAAHTWLEGRSWEPVERFLAERAYERWLAGVALAGAFYQQQAAATPTTFWRHCADTYAQLAGTRAPGARPVGHWQLRPVLNDSLIEMRRVVVTRERPRGVWQVECVELARLEELLRAEPAADVAQAARHLACTPAAAASAVGWLRAHGLLAGGGRSPQQKVMNR